MRTYIQRRYFVKEGTRGIAPTFVDTGPTDHQVSRSTKAPTLPHSTLGASSTTAFCHHHWASELHCLRRCCSRKVTHCFAVLRYSYGLSPQSPQERKRDSPNLAFVNSKNSIILECCCGFVAYMTHRGHSSPSCIFLP